MLGEVVDDEEENNNLQGKNEVLLNNIKCEVCKNIPVDICTCESCNKYYYKKCTQNLTYCVKCGVENPEFKENAYLKRILQIGVKIVEREFCNDYFLEKDLTKHKCKVSYYTCKCCKKYATININIINKDIRLN